jgi:hypothetical protein
LRFFICPFDLLRDFDGSIFLALYRHRVEIFLLGWGFHVGSVGNNLNTGLILKFCRHVPWVMDVGSWNIFELWAPKFDVLSLRVKLLGLG